MFSTNESIPMAFWDTLGQYVYGYMEHGKFVYIGKGNRDRALSHTKTKGYDVANLVIIARNLERFSTDKDDIQSFILESFLISSNEPRDNSVSGHYKECFVMAKWSELFNEYNDSLHDNFSALPEWYTQNYELLVGKISQTIVKSDSFTIYFTTGGKQIMPWLSTNNDDSVKFLRFDIQHNDPEKQKILVGKLKQFLTQLGYEITLEGKKTYEVTSSVDIDQALEIVNSFFS
jgi:hypothetical protein